MDFNVGDKVKVKPQNRPRVAIQPDGSATLLDLREMTVTGYDALVKVTWTAADGVVHEGMYHAAQLEPVP